MVTFSSKKLVYQHVLPVITPTRPSTCVPCAPARAQYARNPVPNVNNVVMDFICGKMNKNAKLLVLIISSIRMILRIRVQLVRSGVCHVPGRKKMNVFHVVRHFFYLR